MWSVKRDSPHGPGAQRLRFLTGDDYLTYAGFLSALAAEESFRDIFQCELREAPFIAYRWETPPLTVGNTDQPFECLLHDSPGLDVAADFRDFAPYFQSGEDVVSFDNLGGDALLVVPCPVSAKTNYSHIAAFHRSAPERQQHALWQAVAGAVQARLDNRPLWLSTAGGGVDWLHVRLDQRPKYYRHQPWRIR